MNFFFLFKQILPWSKCYKYICCQYVNTTKSIFKVYNNSSCRSKSKDCSNSVIELSDVVLQLEVSGMNSQCLDSSEDEG